MEELDQLVHRELLEVLLDASALDGEHRLVRLDLSNNFLTVIPPEFGILVSL
jgi:hypothetical protein